MQTLPVNDYDMAYLDVGEGSPLVCVHGSLCDFRIWHCVLGPLSKSHRVIAVSLRHFFPEQWDGRGDTYSIAQHVSDVIGFIEKLNAGPVDLMGHSRGGHVVFRVAQRRPDLLRRLILAEPGGELDGSLDPAFEPGPSPLAARIATAADKIAAGDVEGGLTFFFDAIEGPGAWTRLPATPKQQLRDNAFTLIGQARDNRPPFSRTDAEAIRTPTLFIGGARTRGSLPHVLRTLAAHVPNSTTVMIPNTTHPMFEQAPQQFCETVLEFLGVNYTSEKTVMQSLTVNGYDMAYLEIGQGRPLVCVHGTLGDFRIWSAVLGPLSKNHRVISVSLRRFFPEHWDGVGDDYLMAQHIADMIGFLEELGDGPVDLMGHSRGGHIAFRVAQQRPDLLRRLVLAEPGGELDATLDPSADPTPPQRAARISAAAEKARDGDIEGALKLFFETIEGDGAWGRLPAAPKQQLRDNVFTLIGQAGEDRKPYSRADAQSIATPTLFIGGADTKGILPAVLRALAAVVPGAETTMIAGCGHWMFEQAPQQFSEIVTAFLKG